MKLTPLTNEEVDQLDTKPTGKLRPLTDDEVDQIQGELRPLSDEEIDSLSASGPVGKLTPIEEDPTEGVEDGGLTRKVITDEELKKIADARGVTVDWLRDKVAWYGGSTEVRDDENVALESAKETGKEFLGGIVGKGTLGGLPQFIYKKTQDPNERHALDDLNTLVNKKRSYGDVARDVVAGAALPVNVFSKGKGIANILEQGGIGALYGLASSREGEEGRSSAIGAGLGAGLGSIFTLLSREVSGNTKVDELVDILEKEEYDILSKSIDEVEDLLEESGDFVHKVFTSRSAKGVKVPEHLELPALEVLKKMGRADEGFKDLVRREGPEAVTQQLNNSIIAEAAGEELAERVAVNPDLRKYLGTRWSNFFKDNRYVWEATDRQLGTNLTRAMDELSNSHNLYTKDMLDVNTLLKHIPDTGKEIDTQTTKQVVKVVARRLEDLGVPAKDVKRSGNIPRQPIPAAEAASKMRLALDKNVNISNIVKQTPETEAEKQYLIVLEYLNGGKAPASPQEVRVLMNKSKDPMSYIGKSDKARVPLMLADFNQRRALLSWANGSLRKAHLSKHIDQIELQSRVLSLAGIDEVSQRLNAYIQDVRGFREGTAANTMAKMITGWQSELLTRAGRTEDKIMRSMYKAASTVPNFFNFAVQQMYPYYLGLRPDAVIRNLFQPALMTAPALKEGYGMTRVLDGYANTVGLVRSGKLADEVNELRSAGILPPEFKGETAEGLQEGILASLSPELKKLAATSGHYLQKMNDVAMYMYSMSDTLNRITSVRMADKWADDVASAMSKFSSRGATNLTAQERGAIQSLHLLPSGYKREVGNVLRGGGDLGKLKLELRNYLVSSTQFNYNRTAMSEYGRWAGGMFSMFTKWPTAIYGDITETIARAKSGDLPVDVALSRGFRRYLAPLLAFSAAERFISPAEDRNKIEKIMIGRQPLYAWSPAASLKGMTNLSRPPVVEFLSGIDKAARTGEVGDVGEDLLSMVPGAVSIKFIRTLLEDD